MTRLPQLGQSWGTMLTRVALAVVALTVACGPTSAPTRQEAATVVIVKSDTVLGEEGIELLTQPVCGGVAVGPRVFLTVDHCVGPVGSAISYVDSAKWRSTSNYFENGTVQSVSAGVAQVLSVRELPSYTGLQAAADGAAELVVLVDTNITTQATELSGGHFNTGVEHGRSGFGVFQTELVGLIDTCDPPNPDNGTECLPTGGRFTAVPQ